MLSLQMIFHIPWGIRKVARWNLHKDQLQIHYLLSAIVRHLGHIMVERLFVVVITAIFLTESLVIIFMAKY